MGLVALGVIGVVIKLTIPLSYAETSIDPKASDFVARLQSTPVDLETVALRYLFFGGDYQDEIPSRIKVSSTSMGDGVLRVRVYDPACEDDSVSSCVERVYLKMDGNRKWMPVKVDWSHTGRGRFGWTTLPTS